MTVDARNYFGVGLPLSAFARNTIKGTSASEILIGTAAGDNINGAGGIDTLIGGSGDDWYSIGNSATDIVEAANGGIDTVIATCNYVLAANVENVRIYGSSGYSGTQVIGNDLANLFVGDKANQYMQGRLEPKARVPGRFADTNPTSGA